MPPPAPVIVFIHGDATAGHGDGPVRRRVLARAGWVVVSVNYRKRFEGFAAGRHPTSSDTGTDQPRGVQDLPATALGP